MSMSRIYTVYKSIAIFSILFFAILKSSISYAQAGESDPTFNIGSGFTYDVRTVAIQTDGKIIAGGLLQSFNGISRRGIARLNQNGSIDNTFDIGTGFYNIPDGDLVLSLAIQSDGKIVVGGHFSDFNGTSINRITRLNSNGSLDTSFHTTGCSHDVNIVVIQPDDKILIGGYFNTYNGIISNRIARLNNDGSIDTSFNVGTGFNNYVKSLTLQPDGKIIVVGDFTTYNGTTCNKIVRLNTDGSIDSSFNIGLGFNYRANSSVVQNDGKIIVGGGFNEFNGFISNRIARLNSDGSFDGSFDIGSGFDYEIYSVNLQSNGKIIVGGIFSTFNDSTRAYIARLNSSGTIDHIFDPNPGFNGLIYNTAIQTDGKIIAVGQFYTFNGISKAHIIRLNSSNLSLEEANGLEMNIYPNPTKNKVCINFDSSKAYLIIRDSFGKIISEEIIYSDVIFDFEKYPSGVYFIELVTEFGIVTKSVLKI